MSTSEKIVGAASVAEARQEYKLDPSLYQPTPEETAFFKDQTGIQSDEELKEHILAIQKEAWDVFPYLCIRGFTFTKLGITFSPRYAELLKLGKERPDAIFLEMGCCFGSDARKTIADGFPLENVVCSDLEPEFWTLGHKLFRTTQETYPVAFVGGSIFDPKIIEPVAPFYGPPDTARPDMKTLNSLNPLRGHISAIHTASFFHLFDEAEQLAAARALGCLLSPEPGSMIFGYHLADEVAKPRPTANNRGKHVYDHSPETWKALWDGVVFEKGKVEVSAILRDLSDIDTKRIFKPGRKVTIMIWNVKRL